MQLSIRDSRSRHQLLAVLVGAVLVVCGTPFAATASCPASSWHFLPGSPIAAVALTPDLDEMPVVADFDGDGKPDFAAHDSLYFRRSEALGFDTVVPTVGVYLNRSTPGKLSFANASVLKVGRTGHCFSCANETDLQAADLRHNGLQDLVATLSVNSSVYVLLNDGKKTGTFLPQVEYPVGTNPLWARIGDFDGDVIPDIATVNLDRQAVASDVWSISFLKGRGDGTFEPAQTLVLPDGERLGRTDDNTVSPYEKHTTEVVVARFAGGAPGGQDVLVIAGVLVGIPKVYWIAPGGSGKFGALKSLGLSFVPLTYDVLGTAPFTLSGGSLIGPGTLAMGLPTAKPFDFDWGTLDPPNGKFFHFLIDNFATLGRLEGFRVADLDGDGQRDVLALFSRLAMVGFGAAGPPHPFSPLFGGAGKVESFPLFARTGLDQPLFHSAALGDFDGDGNLDLLAGSDDEKDLYRLEIYLGTKVEQGGPILLEVIAPSTLREGEKAIVTGRGFKPGTTSPILSATLSEVGGTATWVVPVTQSALFSDTTWVFQVPMLGDDHFWKTHGRSIDLRLVAHNACFDSNSIPLKVVH